MGDPGLPQISHDGDRPESGDADMSIVIGGKLIDASKCVEDEETGESEHHCVHDWRIHWGNVDRGAG
ncbi:head-to-tail connector protein [Mycobacterium phage StepMih]|uniref:Head-to-tail connector protein n=41 Tax=Microwolfvirus TaxID=2942894 RepID=A0A286MQQ4_9CAUD|nr:head-to-tail connector protein [Mycobacterium phage StepMih]QDK02475.1 hypothetical protein SEA_SOSHARI_22 [Mycobacterium phage Soshari]